MVILWNPPNIRIVLGFLPAIASPVQVLDRIPGIQNRIENLPFLKVQNVPEAFYGDHILCNLLLVQLQASLPPFYHSIIRLNRRKVKQKRTKISVAFGRFLWYNLSHEN